MNRYDKAYVKASLAKTSMDAMSIAERLGIPVARIEEVMQFKIGKLTEKQKNMSYPALIASLALEPLTKEEYRRLARENHPDYAVGEVDRVTREEKMKELNSRRRVA